MPLFIGPRPRAVRPAASGRYLVPLDAAARAEDDERGFRIAPPDAEPGPGRLPPVSLPGDELPHEAGSEWWYFAVHLTIDETGRRLTLLFIVLKEHEVGGLPLVLGVVHHVDHDRGMLPSVTQAQPLATTFTRLPPPEFYRFRFSPLRGVPLPLAAWSIRGGDGYYQVRMSRPYGLRLSLEPGLVGGLRSRPVLLGDRGRLDYGEQRELAYYVWPHLKVTGVVETDDGHRSVSGSGWLDRQWGSAPVRAMFWKYVTVQLPSGDHWMFFKLVHTDLAGPPEVRFAVHVDPRGERREFRGDGEVDLVDGPPAGNGYRPATTIRVPAADLELEVAPLFEDQVIVPRFHGLPLGRIPAAPEWFEGVSRARGSIAGQPVDADAMTEIYDPARQEGVSA